MLIQGTYMAVLQQKYQPKSMGVNIMGSTFRLVVRPELKDHHVLTKHFWDQESFWLSILDDSYLDHLDYLDWSVRGFKLTIHRFHMQKKGVSA